VYTGFLAGKSPDSRCNCMVLANRAYISNSLYLFIAKIVSMDGLGKHVLNVVPPCPKA